MLYYYYASKRGLYQAILREIVQSQQARMEEAVKRKGDPLQRLQAILRAWVGTSDEPAVRELRLFFLRELLGLGSDTFRRSVENSDRTFRNALKTIIQDGIDEGIFRAGKVEMAVLAIIGIVNTFSRRAALGVPIDVDEGVEQVMDTFVYGLAVGTPP